MLIERELKNILRELNKNKVDVVLLKGFSILNVSKRNIDSRFMEDIDFLTKEDTAKLVKILKKNKFHEVEAAERLHHRSFIKVTNGYKIRIEVHHNFLHFKNPFSIDIEDFWLRSQELSIGHVKAKGLSNEDLILHLCLHLACQHSFYRGLRDLYDLSEIISHCNINWDKLVEINEKYKTSSVVYFCLELAKDLFENHTPQRVLNKLRVRSSKKQLFLLRVQSRNLFKIQKDILYKFQKHFFHMLWPDRMNDKKDNLKMSLVFLRKRLSSL
jgi:hypothetical protein